MNDFLTISKGYPLQKFVKNETKNDFPDELKSFATSLAIETGHSLQRELVASTLINAFEEYWGKLHESPQEIIADWISVCGHINQKISFKLLECFRILITRSRPD